MAIMPFMPRKQKPQSPEVRPAIGKIEAYLSANDLTLSALANRAKCSQPELWKFMNGSRKDINAAADLALKYIAAADKRHKEGLDAYAPNDFALIERAARELLKGRTASPTFIAGLIQALKPIVELTGAELQLKG